MIRLVTEKDAEAVAKIYNYYIENSVVTFEEKVLSGDDFIQRITEVKRLGLPWFIAEDEGEVIGYAYATKWNERSAYRRTIEIVVYLSNASLSIGWGTKLYEALFAKLRNMPVHIIIGGVTLPNPASVALHEKFGMEKVAHFKEVGFKFNEWLDVGYWQVQINA